MKTKTGYGKRSCSLTGTVLSVLLAASMLLAAGCGTAPEGSLQADSAPTVSQTVSSVESAADAESAAVAITGEFNIQTEDGSVSSDGNIYTLSSAGTYTLSGKLDDGQILVTADDGDAVLVLSGASLTCSTGPVILSTGLADLKVKTAEGSYNEIHDTRASGTADEYDAAVCAESDVSLVGTGSLVLTSNNKGVKSKDDLTVKNLTLKVTAASTALQGNDSVQVESGSVIAISKTGDAVKTTSSDTGSKNGQHGTVALTGGALELYAGSDGIDAAYDVDISGTVSLLVKTGSESPYTTGSGSDNSCKGIKADNEICVSGGTVDVSAEDDGLHANAGTALENGETGKGNITLSGGSLTVKAGDDGVHADSVLTLEGGRLDVTEAHEGLEGHYVNVKGGETTVYGTDDGVNATGSGNASTGLISVSGGVLIVEVGGRDVDGIDSNGNYEQTGGFVVVSNPTADSAGMASATDVDGTVSVTGGVLIALGAIPASGGNGNGRGRFGMGGMSANTVPAGAVTFTSALKAGTHTFSFGDTEETFTLKQAVSQGWIWADGLTSSNYTLS